MSFNSIIEKTKFCFRITATIFDGLKLFYWTFILVFYSRYFSARLKANKKIKTLNIKTHHGPYNIKMRLQDVAIFYEIFFSKIYDISGLHLPTGAVVDIGAHIGLASLYFWDHGLSRATFYCVEPSKEHLDLLEYNTRSLDRTIVNKGISDHNGIDVLDTSGFGYNYKIGSDDQAGEKVNICTIDNLFESNQTEKIALLKIDIEGGEREIFKGELGWLSSINYLFLETHENTKTIELQNNIEKEGFRLFQKNGTVCKFNNLIKLPFQAI